MKLMVLEFAELGRKLIIRILTLAQDILAMIKMTSEMCFCQLTNVVEMETKGGFANRRKRTLRLVISLMCGRRMLPSSWEEHRNIKGEAFVCCGRGQVVQ